MKTTILRWIGIGLVTFTLLGCGGGGETPPADTAQTDAIALIKAYAQSNGSTTAPTAQDYMDAGVEGELNITVLITPPTKYIKPQAA